MHSEPFYIEVAFMASTYLSYCDQCRGGTPLVQRLWIPALVRWSFTVFTAGCLALSGAPVPSHGVSHHFGAQDGGRLKTGDRGEVLRGTGGHFTFPAVVIISFASFVYLGFLRAS